MEKSETPSRVLILDDDAIFGRIICETASQHGLQPAHFASLIELGSFARIKEYNLAIIDYFLGNMRGHEIAEYVHTFFSHIPVLMVSYSGFSDSEVSSWPTSVRKFMTKSEGPEAIVKTGIDIMERENFISRLQSRKTFPNTKSSS